jgi:hypothetical protein
MLRTEHWDVSTPSYMEADTVAHCGESMAGEFCWSVTLTDIQTQWTKSQCGIAVNTRRKSASPRSKRPCPFAILGFDSDNGGEFLNSPKLSESIGICLITSINAQCRCLSLAPTSDCRILIQHRKCAA